MLFGDFNRERAVHIPDASPDGFRELLRFIYTDEAELTDDSLESVLSLADKYLVTDLSNRCVQHVTPANVCRFLPLAELYADLSKHCWGAALNNGDEVLSSEYFLDLPKELLVKLVGSDDLQGDEMTVFSRAIDWAKRRLEQEGRECEPSSIRAILGDALYLIRFPLLDVNDFADGPFASGILNDKFYGTDVDRIRQYHCDHAAQDITLCASCSAARMQKESEHQQPMENVGSLVGADSSQSADANNSRDESAQRCIQSLVHACQCRDANCRRPTCHKMKKVVHHVKLCKKRQQADCPVCKQAIALSCYHSKRCNLAQCPVPFCSNIRQKLNEQMQERLLDLLREKCEAARASCGHPGVHWICWDCYEPCCEVPQCECSVDVHKDRTKHTVKFNGSSAFCGQCGLPIASK
ncbi:TAZ zinc finger family protein [Aphelenchoides avenae]|nr:TAZ zinc finger family protein [Aphelenchus avenae]